jgi:hypothetical protein
MNELDKSILAALVGKEPIEVINDGLLEVVTLLSVFYAHKKLYEQTNKIYTQDNELDKT